MLIRHRSSFVAVGLVCLLTSCANQTDSAVTPTATTAAPATTAGATTTEAPTNGALGTEAPATTPQPTTTPEPTTTPSPTATEPTSAPTTTEPDSALLRILVTNDDGVAAPGIDALVSGLEELDGVEITMVAPAENQSGSSMKTTDGALEATDATTLSGTRATAVDGFPADSVNWALANLDDEFDLVVSGSNTGQNVGEFSAISGTVGAARFAAQHGIDAIAVSQGFTSDGSEIAFGDSVGAVVDWVRERREAYGDADEVDLVSINSATCSGGNRDVVLVPLATSFSDRDPLAYDCESTAAYPSDDVDALAMGYTAITELSFATPPGAVE